MAKQKNSTTKPEPGMESELPAVNRIVVRMYRPGTGDFFLLLFKTGEKVTCKMLIDCGCIQAGKDTFKPLVQDLGEATNHEIDVLVITHEHADHINGFKLAAEQFRTIKVKSVWFAWTESKEDPEARDFRKNYTKIKQAINSSTTLLNGLINTNYYSKQFNGFNNQQMMVKAQRHFVTSLSQLSALNVLEATDQIATMEDFLREHKVIDASTNVRYFYPGETISNEPCAPGIRFFILGPPKNMKYLNKETNKDDGYSQRETSSSVDLAFIKTFASDNEHDPAFLPFRRIYEAIGDDHPIITEYTDPKNNWRNIDHDWLYSAGSLALRYQRSINNTSLVMAIQFEATERILLFTGDAEYGNWASWHDGLTWEILKEGKSQKVDASYILNNVVFYKVGHHLSKMELQKKWVSK